MNSTKVKWLIFNGLFALFFYLGFVRGLTEFLYILMPWAWIIGIAGTSFIFTRKQAAKLKLKQKPQLPSFSRWLDVAYDLVLTYLFASYGAIPTAVIYFLHMVGISCVHMEITELKRKQNETHEI